MVYGLLRCPLLLQLLHLEHNHGFVDGLEQCGEAWVTEKATFEYIQQKLIRGRRQG